ncbi:MAG: hypothetical protein JWP72_1118 [Massilia sp.]|nr:hypothetical protein [Massilia sp.]MDB5791998.1 hypothetical protein [Massilia sp.]
MSTTQPTRSSTPAPGAGILANAFALVQDFMRRITAPATPAKDTSELWQLFRMARGSDSVRPALIRKLASGAGRR